MHKFSIECIFLDCKLFLSEPLVVAMVATFTVNVDLILARPPCETCTTHRLARLSEDDDKVSSQDVCLYEGKYQLRAIKLDRLDDEII